MILARDWQYRSASLHRMSTDPDAHLHPSVPTEARNRERTTGFADGVGEPRRWMSKVLTRLTGVVGNAPPAAVADPSAGLASLVARISDLERANTRLSIELERQRAVTEATAASDAAKSRFLALASHELRTPLNGILGMAELLARTSLSAEQTAYVSAIRTSGTGLLSLVDDVLDIGKMEAGRMTLTAGPVIVETMVEEVIELLAPRAQAKGLELAAHVAMTVPRCISADGAQLTRVLMNLAGNAIKFTLSGGIAIEVSADVISASETRLVVRVRDTGVGIALVDQVRIFGEYEQVDRESARRSGGTGLGLAISRAIARAMGGDITVASTLGSGSTFKFQGRFPIVDGSRPAAFPLAGAHLMIVSGHEVEPPILMRRLFDLGATVHLAVSPDAALDLLASDLRIDAMLIDHARSQDAAEMLSRLHPDHPPAAVLVTPADRQDLSRMKQLAVTAHLVKPIRTASLLKVVTALVAGKTVDPASELATTSLDSNRVALPTSKGLTVLLADDNEINTLLGRTLVESFGYAVEVATDGGMAVAMALNRISAGAPYDVILMDLHMPVLDGFAAIEAIRAREAAVGCRSMIVALSADTTSEAVSCALAAGVDDTMSKPIDSARLAAILADCQTGNRSGERRQQRSEAPGRPFTQPG